MELNAEGHSRARAKLPSKDYEVLAKLKKVLTLELLLDCYRESVLSNSQQETANRNIF